VGQRRRGVSIRLHDVGRASRHHGTTGARQHRWPEAVLAVLYDRDHRLRLHDRPDEGLDRGGIVDGPTREVQLPLRLAEDRLKAQIAVR
jgi:hypothetical protein